MAGPFYNNIKGTTSGTPGTGAFTPNAASSGFLAWSTVPAGWIGLVRYEDGSAWELQYSYWNGTTLSRSATAQFVSSSTGSALTLTSAATAAMVPDGNEIAPHPIVPWRGEIVIPGASSAPTIIGTSGSTKTGTAGSASITGGINYLNEQPRVRYTSATTANAQAGITAFAGLMVISTTAGRGGGEFTCRFGSDGLPTNPRVFVGLTSSTYVGSTAEPSAFIANYAVLGKDSTDTNLQLLVNNGSGGGTKTDTGIALTLNGWYEVSIWADPGSSTIRMLLLRLDTGAIFYGSTSTDTPADTSVLLPTCLIGLNGVNTGTSAVLHFGSMLVRTGAG